MSERWSSGPKAPPTPSIAMRSQAGEVGVEGGVDEVDVVAEVEGKGEAGKGRGGLEAPNLRAVLSPAL